MTASLHLDGVVRHHPPGRITRVIRGRARLRRLPALKGGEERRLRLCTEIGAPEPADDAERRLHLLEVVPAAFAEIEVVLEPRAHHRRQRILEIVGHEPYKLPTTQFFALQRQRDSLFASVLLGLETARSRYSRLRLRLPMPEMRPSLVP